ncbi:MAG: hypothetical protein QME41_08920 [Actinomycetota bacterium]|nr:hypothetical protein [Actinomycetota bacterium]
MKRKTHVALALLALIGIIGALAPCSNAPSTGANSDASRDVRTANIDKARVDAARPSKDYTATGDNIVIKINVADFARGDNIYPKRLPQIIAVDKPIAKDEIFNWFKPLTAIEDSVTPPSPFYPAGNRWFLVDATGTKRGKISIDRFGTVHYLRIGSGDDQVPKRFRIREANALVKDFISSHGGLPEEKLTIVSQGFREDAPNTHMAVMFVMGFGHQFKGWNIHDDILEAGISKLYGAHYVRRWHEFKAHGKDKPLLDADTLAERVIQEYRRLWQSEPKKYGDILSGKYLVSVDFERLVYFDPRPRDPKRFDDARAIYHPGWLTRVYTSEAQTGGFTNANAPSIFEEHVAVGVPLLIVDAHTGEIFERKPKGDNLFR